MGRPLLPRPACAGCGSVCKDRRNKFCSRECSATASRGRPAPHAIGNRWALRENATVWAHYKRMQKLCPKRPCDVCGAEKSIIHHIDHDPKNTVPENLMRMCRACHAAHHHADGRNVNSWRHR